MIVFQLSFIFTFVGGEKTDEDIDKKYPIHHVIYDSPR